MAREWTALVAGERMQVDTAFRDRIEGSRFSNQQWSLIMTAVEFRIENATDPALASLEADTENLDAILPELDAVDGPVAPGQSATADPDRSQSILGAIRDTLGIGGDDFDAERATAAKTLADEYAASLQTHLEDAGRWEEVCAAAAE
jgi:hypothetical protein